MIFIVQNPTESLKQNIRFFEEVITLDDKQEEVIVKALRLMLLVGADHETLVASNLLDILLPKE